MLIKIMDIDEILPKISSKMFIKGVITNNFLTKDIYLQEIENKNLYIYEYKNSLLVFRKRDTHYILNFHIIDDINNLDFVDKLIVTEIPYKTETFSTLFLEKIGFDTVFMREKFTKIVKSPTNESLDDIFEMSNSEKDIVFNFLKENFNSHFSCLSTSNQLYRALYFAENNTICGVLHYKETGNLIEIKHLAVSKNKRGQGISSKLIKKLEEKSNKLSVWTNDDTAKKVYLKNNFNKDNIKSIVLIKEL